MNNKSQVLFYTLMLSALLLVLALYLSPVIKQFINQTQSDMSCGSPGLSEYDQATCYGWDIVLWFMICLFLAIAFIVLGAKLVQGG
jgi:hypothetical protein